MFRKQFAGRWNLLGWPRAGGGQAARIRERDWSATPLGSIEAWPQPLRTAVEMMLASPILASLAVGPERVFLYNDEAARHYGDRHPDVLGQPLAEAFAHEFAAVAPFYERVFAGESLHVPAQPLDPARSGTVEVFDAYLVPVRDVGGEVIAVAMTGFAIGGRLRAEAAHRASEEERRSLIAQMNQGFCILEVILDEHDEGIDYRFLETNPAFRQQAGFEPAGRLMSEIAPIEPIWPKAYGRVALTGTPERIVDAAASFDRKYEVYAFRIGAAAEHRIAVYFTDITARTIAEDRLRESEERQAFLLKLSDTLRSLADPVAVEGAVTRLAMDHLKADRCYYCTIENGDAVVRRDAFRGDLLSVSGRYPISSFPIFQKVVDHGRPVVVHDAATSDAIDDVLRPVCLGLHIISFVDVPVIKDGRAVGILCLVQSAPRIWTPAEVDVVVDLAERTWATVERARAEAALRESEERFAQFAASSSDILWIRDAETLAIEFISSAAASIFGVEPKTLLGDPRPGIAMIVPEDRQDVFDNIARVRGGEAVAHDYRIQRPSDGTFRWMRSTGFPLTGTEGRVEKIGGITTDFTETKLAAEHQAVLLAELQHRVRNIMAMIRAITARTGESAASVQGYGDLMMGRLLALARVQALLTRAANVSVGIRGIVQDEVSVQAQHEGQYLLDGPDIALAPKAAEVLTLAIHELATNALKYGALSVLHGKVTMAWTIFEKRGTSWLGFEWTEEGAPERPPLELGAPRRRGFGSELIEGRVPYELKGRGTITIEPGGARCRLEFPLQEGASILETDAPQRATVFGGALDMTGEPDLGGHRILVVEDDYYLATDAARALQGAGAEVLGPFSTEEDARAELGEQRPDAAVVDINLGLGPSFKLAEHLKDSGIPFVFTTGYDPEVIPAEFEGVERLQKPVQLRQIVGAVSKLLTPAS